MFYAAFVCVTFLISFSFFFSFLNLFPEQTKEALLTGAQEKQGGFPSNFLVTKGLDSGFQFTSVLRGF